MRLAIIGMLTVAVAASACEHGATANGSASGSATTTSAPAASDAAAAASAPSAAPASGAARDVSAAGTVREISLPAGTALPITLDTSVGSDTSRVEQPVRGHLSRPIALHGENVVPAGTVVSGVVTDAVRSGKVKGVAHIGVRFDTLSYGDDRYRIHTTAIEREAQTTKKKDALEIGAPAAGGALIGALLGGKKGAAIGTVAGGGAGTAVVLSTRGKEVHLPKGSTFTLKLAEPVTIRIRG